MTKHPEKSKVVRKLRCAVYTRKSSEEGLEQEFNSLHAQREACEAYIASQRSEGWVLVRDQYDDGGISGGTLYHYFPNKHAIMCALAERWLREVEASLDEIERWRLDALSLAEFAERVVERQLAVYRTQQGILHLVQAMFSIPELRALDQQHDALVIERMSVAFARYGLEGTTAELGRLARAYLELTHALLLVVVNQAGIRSRRTLADLKRVTLCLLQPYITTGGNR